MLDRYAGNDSFKNINESTLAFDLCIGCGICETVCPHDAIRLVFNKYKEVLPKIDNYACVNCTVCVRYCPLEFSKIKTHEEYFSKNNPLLYGLVDHMYYLVWAKAEAERLKSPSGGAVTIILRTLFKNNDIDAVIHAQAITSNIGGIHYEATVSYSVEDIENRRGSFYQALDYSDVLQKIKVSSKKKFALVGVPCIVRGIKNLFINNKDFENKTLFTIALACSHNVTPQFTSFIAESAGIRNNERFVANMRAKDKSELDANNFHTRFCTPSEKILFSQNRFKSKFTNVWRSYYFAKNVCLYCPDFWGEEADVSVKDAWGQWSKEDVLGKSIVVVRNRLFDRLINDSDEMLFDLLNSAHFAGFQLASSTFKQVELSNKISKPLLSKENIKNGMLRYYLFGKLSKVMYKYFGYRIANIFLKIVAFCVNVMKI